MARKVFFSFQYEDVQRAMNVRNSNVMALLQIVGGDKLIIPFC
ncbi:Uncharacterised protein [Enterobacter cloacae]|nr:Uncharacterised protein [Enterobacter cloacae]